ncbi:MAG: hypothetical protein IKU25_06350 [Clostridia bacterium]|nr:hypothetical protein [Clostridia bacterium]
MSNSSNEKINLRTVLINICPLLAIAVFYFLGFYQTPFIILTIIWLTINNYRVFNKIYLFIITQLIMLGSLVISDSIRTILFHFFISDDYESLLISQLFTQIEIAFIIASTVIVSIVKLILKRKRSKNKA